MNNTIDKHLPYWRAISVTCIAIIGLISIIASGGSSGDGGTTTTTATGVFKDSNVSGMGYTSGSQAGTTGTDGSFTYEVGQTVTFAVGGVTVGTSSGQAVVTPVDLVPGGSSASTQVRNIVRFLLMLDVDGNPSNGISISAAVQAVADNWAQVDFGSNDLANELVSIISDAASADGTPHTLPDAMTAQAHLESTLLCTHAGAYTGVYSGTYNGVFGVLVDAQSGEVSGVAVNSSDGELIELSGNTGIAFDQEAAFIAGDTSDGATFSGTFSGVDDISGTWEETFDTGSGTFDGSRVGGSADAMYRFTGIFSGDAIGLFAFDVDANGDVTGTAYTAYSINEEGFIVDESIGLTGTLNGTALTAVTTDGDGDITGTLNTTTNALNGTWMDSEGASGGFSGSGCQLN